MLISRVIAATVVVGLFALNAKAASYLCRRDMTLGDRQSIVLYFSSATRLTTVDISGLNMIHTDLPFNARFRVRRAVFSEARVGSATFATYTWAHPISNGTRQIKVSFKTREQDRHLTLEESLTGVDRTQSGSRQGRLRMDLSDPLVAADSAIGFYACVRRE